MVMFSNNIGRPELTKSLEDYLETVYLLVRDGGYARVRDIAKARSVKASSVTPALRRLSDMGLVDYERREYVKLTPDGETAARRVLSRHRLLTRFFGKFLGMSAGAAEEEACSLEHALSDEGMERMVRFFEFLNVCPQASDRFTESFRECSAVHPEASPCSHESRVCHGGATREGGAIVSVADLTPGQKGRVTQVHATGAIRQRLLDLGILPQVIVEVQRLAPVGDPIWIKVLGSQIALRRAEAEAVLVDVA